MLVGMSKVTFMSFAPTMQYLTVKQVAALLHVTEQTIYRWLKQPDPIPSHQVAVRGRRLFDPAEVQEWIRFRCTSPDAGQVA